MPLWASLLSLPTPDRFPPLSLSPVRQREETFRVMLEWLHTRAARKPVLFVVEDLHWVDASTLEFLGQFLAEGLHDSILTLLTFRPEFKTPWPAVAHQTSLALNRLTRRQVGDLMRKKAERALPEAVIEQVYDRTGGVPLFVEEFTKMVQESGVPDQAGEDSASGQTLLGREIPATLQDLVMARLDRMEGERELAQLAATLGREFSYELLAAVAALDEPTLQAELAKLVQAEILYPKGRPPRCTYIFKHALLEDALYNALVKGKRQQFHRRIAEVLEAQFPQTAETQPELLAHHFTEAGLTEKAVGYWLKAGLRSRERSANVEAIGHLTKGLALLEHARGVARTRRTGVAVPAPTGPRLHRGPRLRRARSRADPATRAASCASGSDEPPQLFGIMLGTWEWHLVRGDLRLCVDLAADGMALAERLNDPGMLMEALFMPGVTMFYRGGVRRSPRLLRESAGRLRRPRAHEVLDQRITGHNAGVTHRCYLALALWHLGYPDQALKLDREMRELARTIGHPFSLAMPWTSPACLYQYCRLGAEVQAAGRGRDRASRPNRAFSSGTRWARFTRAAGLLLQGRRDEALPLLLKGLSGLPGHRGGSPRSVLPQHAGRGLHAGRALRGRARRRWTKGWRSPRRTTTAATRPSCTASRANCTWPRPPTKAAAEDCFRRAIETARRQQSRAWELRATMSLARLWQRQGRRDEAQAALAAVYGTYTEGFTTPDLMDARTLLESLAEPTGTTTS